MSGQKLKKGFTTGAAAAAAAKAALLACLGKVPGTVEISFLNGETKSISVHQVQQISPQTAEVLVIKDAGDDPDITHKALIGARVTLLDARAAARARSGRSVSPGKSDIRILGGKGVGVVTKPGLELPMGEPAINPGPRTMIKNSIKEAFDIMGQPPAAVSVEVFVPEGETLAKKTLNARLGILGGISILGTTGIVTPMSHDAYIATIKSGISVAAAVGMDTLVFTTGRRSERFAMKRFPGFGPEAFIQTGDFYKASLDMARQFPEITTIIYTVFFGKAVKMALGFEHTHAAKSELTLKTLAEWTMEITGDKGLGQQVESANTAREAFFYLYPDHPEVIAKVGRKIIKTATAFAGNKLNIQVILLDFEGQPVFEILTD